MADEIYEEVPQSGTKFGALIEKLCVFRYLDDSLISRIMTDQGAALASDDAYHLADELTTSRLLERNGRFLQDNITRRLLAIRLQHLMSDEFHRLCQHAQDVYAERLQGPKVQMPERWTIEFLFQSLQQHANIILEPNGRHIARRRFFDIDLPKALGMWKLVSENRREEQNALSQAIEDDWEFRFTVNYYLREDEYSKKSYEDLRRYLDRFFEPK